MERIYETVQKEQSDLAKKLLDIITDRAKHDLTHKDAIAALAMCILDIVNAVIEEDAEQGTVFQLNLEDKFTLTVTKEK